MGLTRVDCHYQTNSAQENGGSAFVVLNPIGRPGTVVAAGAVAGRESIGSQVACKLAIEHFVDGVLDRFQALEIGSPPLEAAERESSVDVIESAFKKANSSVYAFGHKLAAAGRMSASLVGMVISDKTVAAARAGEGSAFLLRRGELFPFFESKQSGLVAEQEREQLIGAHSLVSVEVASVPIEPEDVILFMGVKPTESQVMKLPAVVKGLSETDPNPIETVVNKVFGTEPPPCFALLVRIGPEAIYLQQVV